MTCLVKPVIHLGRERHTRMEQQPEQERGGRHPSRSYWPRDVMLSFLQLYRSLECLWRVRSPDYTNRLQREMAYDVLLKKVREVEPQADREYIACKINSIRTSFRKELAKVKRSQKLAHWSGQIYKPRLWYYDHMLFIVEQGKGEESPEPTQHSGEEEGSVGSQYWCEEEASYKEEEEMEILESKPIILEDGSVAQAATSWDESSNPPVEAIVSTPDNLPEPVCQQSLLESQPQAGKRKALFPSLLVSRTNGGGARPADPKRAKLLEEEPLLRQAMQVLLRGRDEHGAFGDYLAHELRSLRSERFRRKLKSMVRMAIVEVVDEETAYLDG